MGFLLLRALCLGLFLYRVLPVVSGELMRKESNPDCNTQRKRPWLDPACQGNRSQESTSWEIVKGWDYPQWSLPASSPHSVADVHVTNNSSEAVADDPLPNRVREGLVIVTMTGTPNIWRALEAQNTWMKRIQAPDKAIFVCGTECAKDTRLKSVVVMPDSLLTNCVNPDGTPCNGYQKAGLKLPFGLVYTYRELVKRQATTFPSWWILKDDDTYVDMPNMYRELAKYDPSKPTMLSVVDGACHPVCGGAGVVLSWSLAEKVVSLHGDEYLQRQVEMVRHSSFWYDVHIYPWMKEWVPNMTLIDSRAMNEYGPEDPRCTKVPTPGDGIVRSALLGGQCHKGALCECWRSAYPATIHLRANFSGELGKVDEELRKQPGADNHYSKQPGALDHYSLVGANQSNATIAVGAKGGVAKTSLGGQEGALIQQPAGGAARQKRKNKRKSFGANAQYMYGVPSDVFAPPPGPSDLRFEYQSSIGRDGFEPDPFRTASEYFGPFRVDYHKHTLYLDNWNLGVSSELDRGGLGDFMVGNGHKFSEATNSAFAGVNNTAMGSYDFVAGKNNIASGEGSVVAGGESNRAENNHTNIDGGESNVVQSLFGVVQGGYMNSAEAPYASVEAGMYNWAGGKAASVIGGTMNSADGTYAAVNGGQRNMVPGGNVSDAVEGGYMVGVPNGTPGPEIDVEPGEGPDEEFPPCQGEACAKALMAEHEREAGATRDRRNKLEKAQKNRHVPGISPNDKAFRRRRSASEDPGETH